MNTLAQELAGNYARPAGMGRKVENMDPLPPSRRDLQDRARTFSEECKALLAKGWSRGAIGTKLGIAPSTVGKYLK
jgi:DNA-binding NarL/FixJ family response regulator